MHWTSAYRGRRVLVTGHTGFKGTWLVNWLRDLGAEVVGYALPAEGEPALFDEVGRAGEMTSIIGDVRDGETIARVVADHRPEIVLHLAAQPLVRLSYDEPVTTFDTNVMGTVNVLEAVRHCDDVRAVVVVTSDKCYENREWDWPYRERDPMGGHDPYSCSKGCAELVTASYRASYFGRQGTASVASARAGNVVGGGDWAADRLVPDIVRAVAAGRAADIRNPAAIRPWQHVLEPLAGYLCLGAALLEHGDTFAEAWNFGPSPDSHVNVGELAGRITSAWGEAEFVHRSEDAAPHEAGFLALDSSKARGRLGWKPRLGIAETVEWTVDWYRRFAANGESAATLVDEQIAAYSRLMGAAELESTSDSDVREAA